MTLIKVDIIKRNGQDYNFPCLLNGTRIVNHYYDNDRDGVILEYKEDSNWRSNVVEYKITQSLTDLPEPDSELGTDKYIEINAIAKDLNDNTIDRILKVSLDNIIKVWESNDKNTYIEIEGGLTKRRYKITETFSQLQTKAKKRVDTIKAHITSKIDNTAVNTWTDFSGFTIVEEDTITPYLSLNEDGKTFTVDRNGLYMFSGCIHVQNNTTGKITVTILSRIIINNTDETRCSQRGKTEDINANGEDILTYSGTVLLSKGDTIKLQYYNTNANLEFYSNSNFQESIAATLWMIYKGYK